MNSHPKSKVKGISIPANFNTLLPPKNSLFGIGIISILLILCFNMVCISQKRNSVVSNLDFIDPTIGNVFLLLVPTKPTVQLPNQIIRFFPQRADHHEDQITSFLLNRFSFPHEKSKSILNYSIKCM